MPVSSNMDPPLAKAEPISNPDRISGITHLKSGKKACRTASRQRSENIVSDIMALVGTWHPGQLTTTLYYQYDFYKPPVIYAMVKRDNLALTSLMELHAKK